MVYYASFEPAEESGLRGGEEITMMDPDGARSTFRRFRKNQRPISPPLTIKKELTI